MNSRNWLLTAGMTWTALMGASEAQAARIQVSEQSFVDVTGYFQPELKTNLDFESPSHDLYIRRIRLFATGQISEQWGFMFGTLTSDVGALTRTTSADGTVTYSSNLAPSMTLADVWMEYRHSDAFKLNIGLLNVPFSRHAAQGGGTLHGLDLHGYFFKREGISVANRDVGVMARGLAFNKKLDYRLAIVDGAEPGGSQDAPRVVGRIAFNAFDADPGYFYTGTFLGEKKILSAGLSFDVQPGIGGTDNTGTFYALALDAIADIPFGKNGMVATVNLYHYGPGGAMGDGGSGGWFDLGYRLDKFEPLIGAEVFSTIDQETSTVTYLTTLLGFNWWIKGHGANLKAQLALTPDITNELTWTKELRVGALIKF